MKILLVEDDTSISRFIAKGLKEKGYVVDVCHDGQAGQGIHGVYPEWNRRVQGDDYLSRAFRRSPREFFVSAQRQK